LSATAVSRRVPARLLAARGVHDAGVAQDGSHLWRFWASRLMEESVNAEAAVTE
jgi:hypothetical protein